MKSECCCLNGTGTNGLFTQELEKQMKIASTNKKCIQKNKLSRTVK
jgi:hypothetical protein